MISRKVGGPGLLSRQEGGRCNGALEIFRKISDFRFQGSTEFLKIPHADYKNETSDTCDYKTQEMWRYGTLQISDFKQADYNLGNEMSTTRAFERASLALSAAGLAATFAFNP